uniref:Putative MYST-like histone acetyltransferase 1 n=1 Tax=Lygus hesperus TaxID=30085 RepID=A0A0A9X776_LYGHE
MDDKKLELAEKMEACQYILKTIVEEFLVAPVEPQRYNEFIVGVLKDLQKKRARPLATLEVTSESGSWTTINPIRASVNDQFTSDSIAIQSEFISTPRLKSTMSETKSSHHPDVTD